MQPRTVFSLRVRPKIPRRLARLEELASNLWYSWDRPTRTLFSRLDTDLWEAVGHNPKAFLLRVDEQVLQDAAADSVFLGNFHRVLSTYDTYHSEPPRRDGAEWLRSTDLIAYFCAEFGFHESFPIYSGGLGILAGDHCKAASDMRLPFVGVGLLYRQGYFSQTIDPDGNQEAVYPDSDFQSLPITPVLRRDGSALTVHVELPGRRVGCKVWNARCGHVSLYLLDTDLQENDEHARHITHQLYGGDRHMRIEQAIVLGVGGVRALDAVQLRPTVWHINGGHAAFLIVERMRTLIEAGLSGAAALECVAANTVFTSHTAGPVSHDQFAEDMTWSYVQTVSDRLVSREPFLDLGRVAGSRDFDMTALGVRGSRYHNGVSRIHGAVSSRTRAALWPQIDTSENPWDYITNGVHVPTFLAEEWKDLFEKYLGFDWSQRITDQGFWRRVDEIPDHLFWSVRQSLKSQMLHLVRYRIARRHFRNRGSEAHLDRLLRYADPTRPTVLTMAFAHHFATYKRPTLLFEDLNWLKQLVCNDAQPVLLVLAGKAHPADQPGQDLIRRVTEIAQIPEFEGRVLFVEDYDLRLARRLVSGVDVWLNCPVYPLDASGTSGMKVGINGVINLSVLNGWWDEAYDGKNGWAIKPVSESLDEARRNRDEAKALYELLEDHVIPLYYQRGDRGYSPDWIRMAKHSIATLLPSFSSVRMVGQYLAKFYLPASRQGRRYFEGDFAAAREVAAWKGLIRECWSKVRLRRLDAVRNDFVYGDSMRVEIAVHLNGLKPDYVIVELVLGRQTQYDTLPDNRRYRFEWEGVMTEQGEHQFVLDIRPELCGDLDYRIRVYPWHELLSHPFEMGLMWWL